MLLALDVGNTNVTIGAFQGERLAGRWRLRTIREQTADEWGILLRNLFSLSSLDLSSVDGVIISSVVPAVDQPLEAMAQRYFSRRPVFVSTALDLGLPIRYDNPREVGADRLANAVAALRNYGGPVVAVDLGTTINFDIVSASGEFLGGVICPGVGMSISGLVAQTARLPMVDFREPEKLIGSNTVGSITSGLYYGFIGMIDGVLERLASELGQGLKAVATGGQGHMIVRSSRWVKIYDEDLTLHGLRFIWERNASNSSAIQHRSPMLS
ncbi:MAG TPA: type III pantothenate kinase [Bryobacteraceae bacterium]|nr:type III pantothenate kinase [Bryobacteraceae bacterium]